MPMLVGLLISFLLVACASERPLDDGSDLAGLSASQLAARRDMAQRLRQLQKFTSDRNLSISGIQRIMGGRVLGQDRLLGADFVSLSLFVSPLRDRKLYEINVYFDAKNNPPLLKDLERYFGNFTLVHQEKQFTALREQDGMEIWLRCQDPQWRLQSPLAQITFRKLKRN